MADRVFHCNKDQSTGPNVVIRTGLKLTMAYSDEFELHEGVSPQVRP